jgi:formiminotetrahydrofolate cyclodeaminase
MEDPCKIYRLRYNRAKETLDMLEKQKAQINEDLKSNTICATLHKELRTVNLNIKITLNEIEHVESNIKDCELEHNSLSQTEK